MFFLTRYLAAVLLVFSSFIVHADGGHSLPQVKLSTNHGDIIIELNSDKAPNTVANFIKYVEAGFYDGTIFHRVIENFMVQGGGFDEDFNQKETQDQIENEANNGLKNTRGTIAMARTSQPHSASSQFFINTVDNDFLNFRSESFEGWGYAVFGEVIEGMDVVDAIRKVSTGSRGHFQDVPNDNVVITSASIVK